MHAVWVLAYIVDCSRSSSSAAAAAAAALLQPKVTSGLAAAAAAEAAAAPPTAKLQEIRALESTKRLSIFSSKWKKLTSFAAAVTPVLQSVAAALAQLLYKAVSAAAIAAAVLPSELFAASS